MRTMVLIRDVQPLPAVPVVVARGDPHKFGNKKVKHKLAVPVPAAKKLPVVTPPPIPVAVKSIHHGKKASPRRRKWWNGLTFEEQQIYVKTHPRSKLKPSRRKKTAEQAAPATDAPTSAPDAAAPDKSKLQKLLHQIHKTIDPHEFAKLFAGSHPDKLANTPDSNVSAQLKTTVQQANGLADKSKLPKPKNGQQARQQLFGHLVGESDNTIIKHVSENLHPKDKELLGKAMDYADKHPLQKNPPHSMRKALGRTLLFALTAGVGGALLGPAGVMLVMQGFHQFANKTGDDMPNFAWRCLRGKALDAKGIEKEQEAQTEHKLDKTEQPVARIIAGLKAQLQQANREEREPIKNLIEDLSEQLYDYQPAKA